MIFSVGLYNVIFIRGSHVKKERLKKHSNEIEFFTLTEHREQLKKPLYYLKKLQELPGKTANYFKYLKSAYAAQGDIY